MKKARREAGRSPLVGHTHLVSRPRAAGCPRDGHTPARIAVRSADNFLVVIEADTGEEVFRVRDDQLGGIELGHVAFSSDGSKLASSEPNGDSTMVWDASTGHLLEAVTGEANPVKDGRVRNAHAVDTYGDGVTLWDVTTDVPVLPPAERVDWTDQFAFSPDGAWLAQGSIGGDVWVLDRASDWVVSTAGHDVDVLTLAFSPDGTSFVTGAGDGMIKIWEAATGQLIRSLAGHSNTVTCLRFDSTGRWLASGSVDRTIKVWDAQTGVQIATLVGHEAPVMGVVFTSKSDRLVSCSMDKTVRIWRALAMTPRTVAKRALADPLRQVVHMSRLDRIGCGHR